MSAITMGEEIRRLRESLGLPVRELARRANVSKSLISAVETGDQYPSESVLERLASELGISAVVLQKFDDRSPLVELRELMHSDPSWNLALRKIAAKAASQKLTSTAILRWLALRK